MKQTPTIWIEKIFRAKTAQFGGVLKRHIRSVEKHASESQLVTAAKARGFHVSKTDAYYVIFCSSQVQLQELC
jgi:hypothetical protein